MLHSHFSSKPKIFNLQAAIALSRNNEKDRAASSTVFFVIYKTLLLVVEYQHCVAVSAKAIFLFHSLVISLHHQVVTAKCSHQHQHYAKRHVEVAHQGVGCGELIRREYKLVGPQIQE